MTIPNLYCGPSDVYDWIGTAGVDLRLDDDNLATGQKVQATADAAQGATTIQIGALTFPLLNGSVLQFSGSGMPLQSQVTLTAVAQKGATSLTVAPLTDQINALSAATDNGVNLATAVRLVKACQIGKGQVDDYCTLRYDETQLMINAQANGSVRRWATALGSRWFCRRLTRPCPKGIEADAQDALEELRMVKNATLSIAYIGTRAAGWPWISNLDIDLRYPIGKVRVIQALSEGTPTQYGQLVDWSSIFFTGMW